MQHFGANKTLSWYLDLFILLLLVSGMFALFLGSYALITPDEGRYAEIAREMVASGNYLTPHLNGIIFFDKPILFYWLESGLIRLFGLSEWAVRILPAAVGVFGALFSYVAGRILYSRRVGILSALMLALSPLYFFMAHYVNMDLLVAVMITVSLFSFIIAMKFASGWKYHSWLINAYLFAALAFLSKGLMGLVFPMMIIGCWILLLNSWRVIARMHLVLGMLLFAIIVAPWFVLQEHAAPGFLHYFFVEQQFTRFLAKGFNDPQPLYFYLPVVLIGVLPWSVFLIQAFWARSKLVYRDRLRYQADLFLILTVILIFVFFSIPTSKIVSYILPVFPSLIMLIAVYLDSMWWGIKSRSIKAGLIIWLVLSVLLASSLIIASFFIKNMPFSPVIPFCYLIGVLLLLGAIALYLSLRAKTLLPAVAILIITMSLMLVTAIKTIPRLNLHSTKPLALALNKYLKKDDVVTGYFNYYQDFPFYIQRPILVLESWDKLSNYKSDTWKYKFFVGSKFHGSDNKNLISGEEFGRLLSGKKRVFIVTVAKALPDFKNQKIYLVARYQKNVLLCNQRVN